MKSTLVWGMLFVSLCSAHAQDKSENTEGQFNVEPVPSYQARQEKRNNLPKGFRGDSITKLIERFESIEKATNDEFTKTSDHNEKISLMRENTYIFVISPEINKALDKENSPISGARYDADAETMQINLWAGANNFILNRNISQSSLEPRPDYVTLVFSENTKRNSYIGQNAYGATAKVSSIIVSEFGLAVANVKQKRNTALFHLSLPMSAAKARAIKGDLAFYVEAQLTRSDTLKGNILKTASVFGATISDPLAIYMSGQYLLGNVKEVGVFRKTSGEVLGRKKFE